MADYMRTNDYMLPQFKHAIDDFVAAGGDRAIAVAVFGVKPEYLEASLDEMQKQCGSIERYFSEALGIDAAGQKALRNLYLGTKQADRSDFHHARMLHNTVNFHFKEKLTCLLESTNLKETLSEEVHHVYRSGRNGDAARIRYDGFGHVLQDDDTYRTGCRGAGHG